MRRITSSYPVTSKFSPFLRPCTFSKFPDFFLSNSGTFGPTECTNGPLSDIQIESTGSPIVAAFQRAAAQKDNKQATTAISQDDNLLKVNSEAPKQCRPPTVAILLDRKNVIPWMAAGPSARKQKMTLRETKEVPTLLKSFDAK